MTDWPTNPDLNAKLPAADGKPPLPTLVSIIDPNAPAKVLTTTSAPTNGGMTTGGGSYMSGSQVTVAAAHGPGFHFSNWTYSNGLIAAITPNFTFNITADTHLTAHFEVGELVPPAPPMQGPVNVFSELMAAADAINRAAQIKASYNQLELSEKPPGSPMHAALLPSGPPIGPGGPVDADESQYMIDVSVSAGHRRR